VLKSSHQVIVLGPPGAGKGTQARRLAERLGLVHISPGELLREQIPADSPSGQRIRALMAAGELIPDDLVDRVVRDRLQTLSSEQGFVLDGYPRTAAEADYLRGLLARLGRLHRRPTLVWLEAPRAEIVRRLRHRRKVEGREDYAEVAIARRLATYDAHAWALREAVQGWTDVIAIDGGRAADRVAEEIFQRLCPPEVEPAGHGGRCLEVHEA
jgi:adenylate kinase